MMVKSPMGNQVAASILLIRFSRSLINAGKNWSSYLLTVASNQKKRSSSLFTINNNQPLTLCPTLKDEKKQRTNRNV